MLNPIQSIAWAASVPHESSEPQAKGGCRCSEWFWRDRQIPLPDNPRLLVEGQCEGSGLPYCHSHVLTRSSRSNCIEGCFRWKCFVERDSFGQYRHFVDRDVL